MPRKKTVVTETQRFPIDDGAVVTIEFERGKRPKMVYLDGVVIVGNHDCGPSPIAAAATPQDGPTYDEIKAWQAKREAQPARKLVTSETVAREQGFNPDALSFENLSRVAESMEEAPVL